MLVEIEVQSCTHCIVAQDVEELFEESRPFAVRNSVEKRFSLICGHNFNLDWVSRAEAVFGNSPELVLKEGDPACGMEVL